MPASSQSRPAERKQVRLETGHLVVGYAMSRLDRRFLAAFEFQTWQSAYESAAVRLDAKWKSIKGLRDEFDPLHPHTGRKGWHGREMLADRVRVAGELGLVSDEALLELVRRVLGGDSDELNEALDALAPTSSLAAAAAERLLTGRRAEEFVMKNCERVLGCPPSALVDKRESLEGFDFLIDVKPMLVVEVKGLRGVNGSILFTDREWREANSRRGEYLLAVVGRVLEPAPKFKVVRDPSQSIEARCVYETAVRATWRSSFSLAA